MLSPASSNLTPRALLASSLAMPSLGPCITSAPSSQRSARARQVAHSLIRTIIWSRPCMHACLVLPRSLASTNSCLFPPLLLQDFIFSITFEVEVTPDGVFDQDNPNSAMTFRKKLHLLYSSSLVKFFFDMLSHVILLFIVSIALLVSLSRCPKWRSKLIRNFCARRHFSVMQPAHPDLRMLWGGCYGGGCYG